MAIPPISALPPAPNRSTDDPASFAAKADPFTAALVVLGAEANAFGAAANAQASAVDADAATATASAAAAVQAYNAVVASGVGAALGTSASAVMIGTGTKAFTASTGKIWYPGEALYARDSANPANWMAGEVTSYDPVTGALSLLAKVMGGAGTISAWDIYPAGSLYMRGWETLATIAPTGAGPWSFTSIRAAYPDYSDLLLEIDVVGSGSSMAMQLYLSADSATWGNISIAGASTTNPTWRGAITLSDAAAEYGSVIGACGNSVIASPGLINSTGANTVTSRRVTGGIDGVRLQLSTGTLTAGTIKLKGRR